MLVKIESISITEDDVFKTPIIILESGNKKQKLPIYVGPFEGQAIQYGLDGNTLQRPLPYDTILDIMIKFHITIDEIIIGKLINNTYYATIKLTRTLGSTFEVDSRPSDAIALAVRWGCPIYVSEELFDCPRCHEDYDKTFHLKSRSKSKPVEELKPEDFDI